MVTGSHLLRLGGLKVSFLHRSLFISDGRIYIIDTKLNQAIGNNIINKLES